MHQELLPSFPDLDFHVDYPAEQGGGNNTLSAVCFRIRVTGTHTGKPFGLHGRPKGVCAACER